MFKEQLTQSLTSCKYWKRKRTSDMNSSENLLLVLVAKCRIYSQTHALLVNLEQHVS